MILYLPCIFILAHNSTFSDKAVKLDSSNIALYSFYHCFHKDINLQCFLSWGQLQSRMVLDSRCHLALQVEIYCMFKNVKKVTTFCVISYLRIFFTLSHLTFISLNLYVV